MGSLRNVASVLKLLSSSSSELTVTGVSKSLGVPKSSASRLLKSMSQEGFLARMGYTPKYTVGSLIVELKNASLNNSTLMEKAEKELANACSETNQSGYISILDDRDIIVFRAFSGSAQLRVVTPLGTRMPAFATSNGRALLALRSNEDISRMYSSKRYFELRDDRERHNAPRNTRELLERLDAVRRTGWSEAVDEAAEDVGSVAVSVSDQQTGDAVACCLSFPAYLVSKSRRAEYGARLLSMKADVEGVFAQRPPRQEKTRP